MRKVANAAQHLEETLTAIERAALAALLAFMVALAFLQVVLRSVLSVGFLWADTLLRHLVLWLGFLGAGLAAGSDKQFSIDALAKELPAPFSTVARLITHLFAALVCALMTRAASTFFWSEYAQHQELFRAGAVSAPAWLFELILPLGFAILCIHYLVKLVAQWR